EHVAAGDEEEKGFSLGPALHLDERLHRLAVDGAAKAVHRFGGVREHAPHLHLFERSTNGRRDLRVRPERNGQRRTTIHSVTPNNPSTRAKSLASVTFMARSLPRTAFTGIPSSSRRPASSDVERCSTLARRCASTRSCRGNPCGVCARQSPS